MAQSSMRETHITEEGCVRCMHCGSSATRHYAVDVFLQRETSEDVLHIEATVPDTNYAHEDGPDPAVPRPSVTVDHDMANNPSRCRSGVSVYIFCENCGRKTVLSIAQEKGQTIVEAKKANENGEIS